MTTPACDCGKAAGKCSCGVGEHHSHNGHHHDADPYIYALGQVEARFTSLGVEKEFAQARRGLNSAGRTDGDIMHEVLSRPENRYLARKLCWVFRIQGMESYILRPMDSVGLDLLIASLRPRPKATDLDIVIGVSGPAASPDMCNGLGVPQVMMEQIYSFDEADLIDALPRPKGLDDESFTAAAEELLARILHLTGNYGANRGDRAINYLAVRYPNIYRHTWEQHLRECSLSGVQVLASPLAGVRRVVDVVFTYTDRHSDIDSRYSVRVDVTELFPFLVTKLSPFFGHA
jgi:hypothetical protein